MPLSCWFLVLGVGDELYGIPFLPTARRPRCCQLPNPRLAWASGVGSDVTAVGGLYVGSLALGDLGANLGLLAALSLSASCVLRLRRSSRRRCWT
jgi:hypothetical protein